MWRKLRPYLLGLIFGALHAVRFILVSLLVASSKDAGADMLFYVFVIIDTPVAKYDGGLGWIFLLGTLWWFGCGFALQSLIFCRQKGGERRLALATLGLLFLSSNLLLLKRSPSDTFSREQRPPQRMEGQAMTAFDQL